MTRNRWSPTFVACNPTCAWKSQVWPKYLFCIIFSSLQFLLWDYIPQLTGNVSLSSFIVQGLVIISSLPHHLIVCTLHHCFLYYFCHLYVHKNECFNAYYKGGTHAACCRGPLCVFISSPSGRTRYHEKSICQASSGLVPCIYIRSTLSLVVQPLPMACSTVSACCSHFYGVVPHRLHQEVHSRPLYY